MATGTVGQDQRQHERQREARDARAELGTQQREGQPESLEDRGDAVDPAGRSGRDAPVVQDEPGDPGDERRPPHAAGAEQRGFPVAAAPPDEVVRAEHGGERDEHRSDQEQEQLVPLDVEDQRQREAEEADHQHRGPARCGRGDVLRRDGGRVDVGEGVVALADEQREQHDPPARERHDRRADPDRPGARRRDEDEQRAQRVEPHVADQVPRVGPERAARTRPREPRVVRREREPRHRQHDHEIHGEPEREPTLPRCVPCSPEVARSEHLDGDPRGRGDQDVDPESLEPPANDQHRSTEREPRTQDRDDHEPARSIAGAEQPLRGDARHLGHHPELHGRPAHELHDVERGREPRAPDPEHRAEQDHRRDALALPCQRDERERHAADRAADDDGEQRLRQSERGDQERAGDHDEQADGQVAPQDGEVEPAERASLRRNRPKLGDLSPAFEEPSHRLDDARHARSLRRYEPDQVRRVAGPASGLSARSRRAPPRRADATAVAGATDRATDGATFGDRER